MIPSFLPFPGASSSGLTPDPRGRVRPHTSNRVGSVYQRLRHTLSEPVLRMHGRLPAGQGKVPRCARGLCFEGGTLEMTGIDRHRKVRL